MCSSDLANMVHRLFEGRVVFHNATSELEPGISLHHIGGHTMGLQSVRVMTERGPLVLASDSVHLYAHIESGRAYPLVYNVPDMLKGHSTLRALAASENDIIPGHDPLVCSHYPAARRGLENIVMRLDKGRV